MRIGQNVDFFFCSLFFCQSSSSFCSLSFPLCLSQFIGSFVAHFIVLLSHEMLAGFVSNKGRDLICKE